jgi:hypothetical protein
MPQDIKKVVPKGPEPLPLKTQPRQRLRPAPSMWKEKTLLQSRTILTIAFTILGFVVTKIFGLDVDLGSIVEVADGVQVGELVLLVGTLIAAYFRKNATGPIVPKPSNG